MPWRGSDLLHLMSTQIPPFVSYLFLCHAISLCHSLLVHAAVLYLCTCFYLYVYVVNSCQMYANCPLSDTDKLMMTTTQTGFHQFQQTSSSVFETGLCSLCWHLYKLYEGHVCVRWLLSSLLQLLLSCTPPHFSALLESFWFVLYSFIS